MEDRLATTSTKRSQKKTTTRKKAPIKKTTVKKKITKKPLTKKITTVSKEKKRIAKLKEEQLIQRLNTDIESSFNRILNKEEIKNIVDNYGTTRKKTGRPTKYSKTMINKILLYSATGMSLQLIYLKLNISDATLLNWKRKYPEFLSAIKRAKKIRKEVWIELGRRNIQNKDFNNVLYMMCMSNMFGWLSSHSKSEKKIKKSSKKTIKVDLNVNRVANIGSILAKSGAFSIKSAEGRVCSKAE